MIELRLSIIDKLLIFFKGNFAGIGLFFFLIGGFMATSFAPITDFKSAFFMLGTVNSTQGRIEVINDTNSTMNEEAVMEYEFSYSILGELHSGKSYSTSTNYYRGEAVDVEYLENFQEVSRISGMQSAPFPIWVFLFVILFPAIGFSFMVMDFRKALYISSVLKNGVITTARKESTKATSTRINKRRLYKMEYSYYGGYGKCTNITKSLDPANFGAEEQVIYSFSKPEKSVLVKKLPSRVLRDVEPYLLG